MATIPSGVFTMGSNRHQPEEAPAHRVRVDAFHIDRRAVTNADFAAFVAATGYVTVAERPLSAADYPGVPAERLTAGSMVFRPTTGPVDLRRMEQWWAWTPGANWRRPEGRGSGLRGRKNDPVVHVAHADAAAYATWRGKRLPTEAEWEYAARGGLDGADYTWGDERLPDGLRLAHWWSGDFPWRSARTGGRMGTLPVGSFPANGYGLFDMAGNVWEWTDDWYTTHNPQAERPCCIPANPRGGSEAESLCGSPPTETVPRKVVKGGSWLCADEYCRRYRPAARRPQPVDTGMSHVGFRCVADVDDVAAIAHGADFAAVAARAADRRPAQPDASSALSRPTVCVRLGELGEAPHDEVKLDRHRLLTPQDAVVVEHGDPLLRRGRQRVDEADHGIARRGVTSGRKIVRMVRHGTTSRPTAVPSG